MAAVSVRRDPHRRPLHLRRHVLLQVLPLVLNPLDEALELPRALLLALALLDPRVAHDHVILGGLIQEDLVHFLQRLVLLRLPLVELLHLLHTKPDFRLAVLLESKQIRLQGPQLQLLPYRRDLRERGFAAQLVAELHEIRGQAVAEPAHVVGDDLVGLVCAGHEVLVGSLHLGKMLVDLLRLGESRNLLLHPLPQVGHPRLAVLGGREIGKLCVHFPNLVV
mmetsp:Transcript_68099/g.181196  ORF Transcript_68099/g.181196 Transcript_68099/m.181196 type:complete len:222 (+) Transcript_68099:685-1350(+)